MADDNEQNTDQQVEAEQQDPYTQAVERIQYGSPEEGRDALIGVTRAVVQHERNLAAIAECEQREKEIVAEFERANPSIAGDAMLSAAARQYILDQQRTELEALGAYDPKQHAGATSDQIMTAHKAFRAAKDPGATTAQQLLERAVNEIEGRFGVRARPTDIDESRSNAMAQRAQRAAELTGRPRQVIDWERSSDSDQ